MVGQRLKEMRDELNISRQYLADIARVTYAAVGRWENGTIAPSRTALALISLQLGVSEEWLTTGNGDMFSDEAELEKAKSKIAKDYEDKIKSSGNEHYLDEREEKLLSLFRSLNEKKKEALLTFIDRFS